MDRQKKFEKLKALHERDTTFVIANAWNGGSARMLTALGYEALATTSAGLAFSLGCRDSALGLTRKQVLENAKEIVESTHLPVSGDLEEGFGPSPQEVVDTVALACDFGLVGGAIEDATGDHSDPIFEFDLAVERIAAASEVAKSRCFLLTARAENYLYGRPDLEDTIKRLVAFQKAGADVLYAPGLPSLEAIAEVCSALSKPVNVVMGLSEPRLTKEQLQGVGVKRISVGGSFARAALGGFMRAAEEVLEFGTFNYASEALPDAKAASYMSDKKRN